jgi:hypothetical protein
MNTVQMNAISSPAAGLIIYNTDTKSFWSYDGAKWGSVNAHNNRRVYIPAGSFGYPNGTVNQYPFNSNGAAGLYWANTTQFGGFAIPRPADWDSTTAFSVTLYFALITNTGNTFVDWRMYVGANIINTNVSNANTGWDQLTYAGTVDAGLLVCYAVSGHSYLTKSQTFTAQYSSVYNTYYFGSGVNTNNEFSIAPMWSFSFERGIAAGNGETYSGDMIVIGASIDYQSK